MAPYGIIPYRELFLSLRNHDNSKNLCLYILYTQQYNDKDAVCNYLFQRRKNSLSFQNHNLH